MFDLSVLLNVEMQILIFFGLGLHLKKRGVTDGPIDAFLSTLILNLIMPVNIFLDVYKRQIMIRRWSASAGRSNWMTNRSRL